MAQSSERAAQKLQQMSDEAQAFNFEMERSSRNINNFISNIEKLESLRYLTPEQEKELENLRERLLELIDEDVANQFRAGLIT
jgi:tyrosine-protein phosphatase YwqE